MEKFWSVKEVAEYLSLSKSSIYRLTSTRQIPHMKIHGKLIFNPQRILEWVEGYAVELGV